MSAAQKTIKYDGIKIHMICADKKTIKDNVVKTHTTCVENILNQQMDIGDIATRPFTLVAAT